MRAGDSITIRFLSSYANAHLLEVEKYRGAYLLHYQFVPSKNTAYGVVFPDIPQLPPATWFSQELYSGVAWLEWEKRLFPMPMGGGPRRIVSGVDPRKTMRRRIDLIIDLHEAWSEGTPILWDIRPQNEWEYAQWKKLPQNSGR